MASDSVAVTSQTQRRPGLLPRVAAVFPVAVWTGVVLGGIGLNAAGLALGGAAASAGYALSGST